MHDDAMQIICQKLLGQLCFNDLHFLGGENCDLNFIGALKQENLDVGKYR